MKCRKSRRRRRLPLLQWEQQQELDAAENRSGSENRQILIIKISMVSKYCITLSKWFEPVPYESKFDLNQVLVLEIGIACFERMTSMVYLVH
jgi:hypothetical protein